MEDDVEEITDVDVVSYEGGTRMLLELELELTAELDGVLWIAREDDELDVVLVKLGVELDGLLDGMELELLEL